MKFPYAVKYNGVIYPANTEIKEVKPKPLTEEAPKEETPKKEAPKKAAKGDK